MVVFAMVVFELMIGDRGRALAMSGHTRRQIGMFWSLIGEILIAVPFVLIGLEVLLIAFTVPILMAGGVAVQLTLAARWRTVGHFGAGGRRPPWKLAIVYGRTTYRQIA